MRFFMAAMLIAFSTLCAFAQYGGGSRGVGDRAGKSAAEQAAEQAEERKNRQIDEKAYRDAISRIPDKTPVKKPDPWGNVR
jgi:hypothetical protein